MLQCFIHVSNTLLVRNLTGTLEPVSMTTRTQELTNFAPKPAKTACFALLACLTLTACGTGARPTLVDPATDEESIEFIHFDLAPAPAGTAELPPASADLPLESSVDDALFAWAAERNVSYTDACERVTPAPDELCDSPTQYETVRFLGPSADEVWYVVIVEQVRSVSAGDGYRVRSTHIAGS